MPDAINPDEISPKGVPGVGEGVPMPDSPAVQPSGGAIGDVVEKSQEDAKDMVVPPPAGPMLQQPDIEAFKLKLSQLSDEFKSKFEGSLDDEHMEQAEMLMFHFMMFSFEIMSNMWDKYLDNLDEIEEAEEKQTEAESKEKAGLKYAQFRQYMYEAGENMLHMMITRSILDASRSITAKSIESHEEMREEADRAFARTVARTVSNPEFSAMLRNQVTGQIARREGTDAEQVPDEEIDKAVATFAMSLTFRALGRVMQIPLPNTDGKQVKEQVIDAYEDVGEAKMLRQLFDENYTTLVALDGKNAADAAVVEMAESYGKTDGSPDLAGQVTSFIEALGDRKGGGRPPSAV